jgi:hypothetical protein
MVVAGGHAVRTPLAQTTESLQTNSKQATQLTITNLTDHKQTKSAKPTNT